MFENGEQYSTPVFQHNKKRKKELKMGFMDKLKSSVKDTVKEAIKDKVTIVPQRENWKEEMEYLRKSVYYGVTLDDTEIYPECHIYFSRDFGKMYFAKQFHIMGEYDVCPGFVKNFKVGFDSDEREFYTLSLKFADDKIAYMSLDPHGDYEFAAIFMKILLIMMN